VVSGEDSSDIFFLCCHGSVWGAVGIWGERDRFGDPWKDHNALTLFCSYTCLYS